MKLKLFTAATCLAISSYCFAAINPGTDYDQGGELIFSVWDHATSTSYTLDLGINTRNFDGNGTYTYDLSSDENWEYFKAGIYDLHHSSIEWDIAAADRNNDRGQTSYNGLMLTANNNPDDYITNIPYGLFNTMQHYVEKYQNHLDALDETYSKNNSYMLTGSDYVGIEEIWDSWRGIFDYTSANYGENMDFWHLTTTNIGTRFAGAIHTKLAGTWTLSDNQLVYTTAAPVPVPAAVWLFGSALAGLVGISRRRRS